MCVHVGGKSTPKCNEKDNFHKALPNVKKAYVTLRKFTPDLKIFYTDISAISMTLHEVYSFSFSFIIFISKVLITFENNGQTQKTEFSVAVEFAMIIV